MYHLDDYIFTPQFIFHVHGVYICNPFYGDV